MPNTYVVNTDLSVVDNVTTFATRADVVAKILVDHGSVLSSGIITVYCRNSTGVPLSEVFSVNEFFGDANNRIKFIGQMSNGYPFVVTEPGDNTSDFIFQPYDDGLDYIAEEEDSFIIRAHPVLAGGRTMMIAYKPDVVIDGLVFDGNSNPNVSGIGGSGATQFKNCKMLRLKHEFYGAVNNGNATFDHCTFNECSMIRAAGPITNSIITNTPLSGVLGSGLAVGCDFNAYDVPQSEILYSGVVGDANSFFSINVATELSDDTVGAYNLASGSSLEGRASDGGNIGAYVDSVVGLPPVISITETNDTLTATVSDDITASPSLQLFVDGVATGSAQTATSWDMTSYGLTQGVYRITVQATDGDSNTSVSNQKYYSVGGVIKILWLGNSLTENYIEPNGGTTLSVIDAVREMYTANGGEVFIEDALLGGASFVEHNANQPTHDAIATGNFDIVLAQGEAKTRPGYTDYLTYLAGEMKPLADGAKAVGSDFIVWSHQPYGTDTTETFDTQQTAFESMLVAYPDIQYINAMKPWWNVRQADPTLDLYADNIHQNAGGSYLSALAVYKFLTNIAVTNMSWEDPSMTLPLGDTGLGYSAADVQLLKTTANTDITNQFVRSAVNSCVVTITAPAGAVSVTQGDAVTLTATAIDDTTGDLSSTIVWQADGLPFYTGATITKSDLPTGNILVTANCVGSDGNTSVAARSITVRTLVNAAPVTQVGARTVLYQESFTQMNLSALVSDDNDEVDWASLTITQQPVNGVATKDGQTLSTINLDFSAGTFSGQDSFKYTVRDLDGLVSNESTVTITVDPPLAPSGVIANSRITRGLQAEVVMSNYVALNNVNVSIASGATEYACTLVSNADDLLVFNVPDSSVITAPIASTSVIVRGTVAL